MVKAVRVKGIVKLMNRVREKLSNGLSVRELEELKVCVDNSLDTIESICVQNQIVPTDLPAPSYRAYSYLKNLDLNKIVPVMPSQQGRGKKEIKIPGLVKQCHSISDEINRLDRDFYSRDSEVYARETESARATTPARPDRAVSHAPTRCRARNTARPAPTRAFDRSSRPIASGPRRSR